MKGRRRSNSDQRGFKGKLFIGVHQRESAAQFDSLAARAKNSDG
jgi:hypothetical protein